MRYHQLVICLLFSPWAKQAESQWCHSGADNTEKNSEATNKSIKQFISKRKKKKGPDLQECKEENMFERVQLAVKKYFF